MFQEGTFDEAVKEDFHLEAYENKINCNCQMKWFKQWADEVKSISVKLMFFFKPTQFNQAT